MKYNKIEAILNLVSRGELNVYELLDDFVENLIFINPDRFNYRSSKKSYRLLSIHLKITLLLLLLLLLLTPFDLNCAVCAQQAVFGQDSSENTSGETADRLDTIIDF